jgi:hypothetical protein
MIQLVADEGLQFRVRVIVVRQVDANVVAPIGWRDGQLYVGDIIIIDENKGE